MVFSSTIFLIVFLPMVLAAGIAAPRAARNTLLIVASLLFYAWGEKQYVVLLMAMALGNWLAGLWIARGPRNRWRVALAVAANLLVLGVFKYLNFLIASWNDATGAHVPLQPIHLPAGVSFFTFQAIAYVVDVHRNDTSAETSLSRYSLYTTLFPHLVAGPIVRYRDLAGQLRERSVGWDDFAEGVQRFVVGLAKKVLLADALRPVADDIVGLAAGDRSTGAAWLGLIAFSLQIYFDFSGYSDMAIGLGRMFGFRFAENFNYPYAAASLADFWRRWHMTLSSWLRDYVYIPLGGGRRNGLRNLLLTFLACGLWHGAAWPFVAWGAWHGVMLGVERLSGRRLGRLGMLVAVSLGWVLFRAPSLAQAGEFFTALAGFGEGRVLAAHYLNGEIVLALLFGCIAAVPVGPWLRDQLAAPGRWSIARCAGMATVEFAGSVLLLAGSMMVLAGGTYQPFLYFRF